MIRTQESYKTIMIIRTMTSKNISSFVFRADN